MGINWGWGGQGGSGAASVTNERPEETGICTLFYPQSSPQNLNSPLLKLASLLKICKSWIFSTGWRELQCGFFKISTSF